MAVGDKRPAVMAWQGGLPGGYATLNSQAFVPPEQLAERRLFVRSRVRDGWRDAFGLGGGGDDGGAANEYITLKNYTGETGTGIVVNGVWYDAVNVTADSSGDEPDGTFIVKPYEQSELTT